MSRGLDWLVIALPEGEAATARVEHLIGETRLYAPSLVERYRDTRLVVLSADPITVMRCGADERLILLGSVRIGEAGGGGQAAAGGVLPNGDGLQDLGAPESGSHQTGMRDAACGPPLVARLLERAWGAYIAIWTEQGDGRLMVDPSGSQPAVITRRGPLTLAAADLPRWIWRALGARPTIDWRAVAASMVRSVVPTHTALLEGVRVAIPGEPVSLGDPSRALAPLWSPSLICSRSTAADASAATLRAVVESTVLAQASGRATLVQLSGGLDSSIVLSCLSRGLSSDRLIAFTMATRHAGGDERSYARIAADAFGVRLASRFAPERPIDHRGLLAVDHGVRPYLYGLDAAFEGAVAAVAEASGAELVMTGQGGDAVFIELPSPAVFVDRVRRDGLRALGTAAAVADAERCDVSWWTLASAVLRDRLGLASPTPSPVAPELLSPEARAMLATGVPTHPWIVQAQALPPGRRVQIEAIANGQILFAPRPGPDPLPIAHPLLAQPVVDHVLSLSTADLCFGVGDRALARAAFAQRLPGPILARRVKGEASSHYSRAVSADRADLREMLLDGPLQAAGLLDRAAVEQAIAPHTLVFGDAFRALSLHASLSAWAGYWRDTR